jgi:ribosomal subunit interface protein
MSLRISGKNLDVGDALRSHIEAKLSEAVEKYFDGGYSGHVTVAREGSGFKTECVVHLDSGIVLQAEATAQDARQSFDRAEERIGKRVRRYKRKLKDHPSSPSGETVSAQSYVLVAPDGDEEESGDYAATVIAEETTVLATMTVEAAVMAMDLTDLPVVVFRHAAHGGLNVVYRRADGNIGWIDPSLAARREPVNR